MNAKQFGKRACVLVYNTWLRWTVQQGYAVEKSGEAVGKFGSGLIE